MTAIADIAAASQAVALKAFHDESTGKAKPIDWSACYEIHKIMNDAFMGKTPDLDEMRTVFIQVGAIAAAAIKWCDHEKLNTPEPFAA